jgi:hypothetical protein
MSWKTDWSHAKAQEKRCDSDITTKGTLETWSHIHRLENDVRENCEMWSPRFERQRALDRGMVMIGRYCLKVTLEQPASCIQVVHAAALAAQAVYESPQELVERVYMNLHRAVRMHRVAQTLPGLGITQSS